MSLLEIVLGFFIFIEAVANLIWWRLHPPIDRANSKMQTVWEIGRVIRAVIGATLMWLGH